MGTFWGACRDPSMKMDKQGSSLQAEGWDTSIADKKSKRPRWYCHRSLPSLAGSPETSLPRAPHRESSGSGL